MATVYDITAETISAVYAERFDTAFPESLAGKVAFRVPGANAATVVAAMLQDAPAMSTWSSARTGNALAAYAKSLELVNKETHFTIPKQAWKSDISGLFEAKASQLVKAVTNSVDNAIVTVLTGVSTDIEGNTLFGSHTYGSNGAQKNDLTASEIASLNVGTPTDPTVAEAAAILKDVLAYAQSYKNEYDQVATADAKKFVVLANTLPIYSAFKEASLAEQIVDQGEYGNTVATNYIGTLRKAGIEFDVQYCPTATGTNKLHFLRADEFDKGIVIGEDPEEFQYLGPDSEWAKINGNALAGISKMFAVGAGRWQNLIRVTLS